MNDIQSLVFCPVQSFQQPFKSDPQTTKMVGQVRTNMIWNGTRRWNFVSRFQGKSALKFSRQTYLQGRISAVRNLIHNPAGSLVFQGQAAEYQRIWVVNLFLSVITLGIYTAWAKVRTRKYLYGNTFLNGFNFDYTADPMPVLKGNLIVAVGSLVYSLTGYFDIKVLSTVLACLALLYPLMVFQSVRFMANNSKYMNLPFTFHGTLGAAYKYYLLWMLLVPLSLGFVYPHVAFLQRSYIYNNIGYGQYRSRFLGNRKDLYSICYKTLGVAVLLALVYFLTSFLVLQMFQSFPLGIPSRMSVIPPLVVIYLVLVTCVIFLQKYHFAQLTNYTLNHLVIDGLHVSFRSQLDAWELTRIQLSNILMTVFTLGILGPHARIRYLNAMFESVTVSMPDQIHAVRETGNSTSQVAGSAASDFLGIELGL